MSEENSPVETDAKSSESETPRLVLIPNPEICTNVKTLISDRTVSIESLTEAISKDPVIVIELLKAVNSVDFAPGKSPITSISNAITSLGMDTLDQTLNRLLERPAINNSDLSECFEAHRKRCVETARVARIIARISSPSLANAAYTSALLMFVGDMLAVLQFKGKYAELNKSQGKRSKINYRLLQDFDYDVEANGIKFLEQSGVPDNLCSSLNRDDTAKSSEGAEVRTICFSATELIDAFESGRWDKFAPEQDLPSSSYVRMLQISDQQYAQLYQKLGSHFAGDSSDEEQFTDAELQEEATVKADSVNVREAETPASPASSGERLPRINMSDLKSRPVESPAQTQPAAPEQSESAEPVASGGTVSNRMDTMFSETLNWLKKAKEVKVEDAKQKESAALHVPDAPPSMSLKTKQALSGIENMISDAKTSEALLTELINKLVDCGLFKKSALLVVADDRKSAIVQAAAGEDLNKGQTVIIDDPFSPLARACSSVQSIANKDSDISPFGTKSFALAPLESKHEQPVILYADCGSESISLAGRRLFRNIVSALNERLVGLPGGLPK